MSSNRILFTNLNNGIGIQLRHEYFEFNSFNIMAVQSRHCAASVQTSLV